MLREVKTGVRHYFVDEHGIQGEYKAWHDNGVLLQWGYCVDGKLHGEYKSWHDNVVLCNHGHCADGKLHGEYKSWYDNGGLRGHQYYVNDELVHDFLESPLSDIEKMLLVLKYGGKLLPRGEVC